MGGQAHVPGEGFSLLRLGSTDRCGHPPRERRPCSRADPRNAVPRKSQVATPAPTRLCGRGGRVPKRASELIKAPGTQLHRPSVSAEGCHCHSTSTPKFRPSLQHDPTLKDRCLLAAEGKRDRGGPLERARSREPIERHSAIRQMQRLPASAQRYEISGS